MGRVPGVGKVYSRDFSPSPNDTEFRIWSTLSSRSQSQPPWKRQLYKLATSCLQSSTGSQNGTSYWRSTRWELLILCLHIMVYGIQSTIECFHQRMSLYNEKMLTQWVPAGADAVKSVEDAVTGAFQYVKFACLLWLKDAPTSPNGLSEFVLLPAQCKNEVLTWEIAARKIASRAPSKWKPWANKPPMTTQRNMQLGK